MEWQLPIAAIRYRLPSCFRVGVTFAVAEQAYYVEVFEPTRSRYALKRVRYLNAKDTVGKVVQQALGA
jgi:hypothetical protein